MAKLENFDKLIATLKLRAAKYPLKVSVTVGFSAEYAMLVHENMEAHHQTGQSKFLESPARQLAPLLAEQIKQDMRAGLTEEEALLRAGLKLQAEAQKLTPVLTGNLRASAYTKLEEVKRT